MNKGSLFDHARRTPVEGALSLVLHCNLPDTGASVQTQRSEYLSYRRKFEPTTVKLVIVAESPPDSGKYFYNPTGAVTEWLFAALMKQLGVEPKTKDEGLREFQRRGWALIDATYEPVNKRESKAAKKEVILRDYPLLRDDLKRLLPDLSTPVVLVKANVCRLLEPRLAADGFNVINKGQSVSFPAFGQQPDFHRQFCAILKSAKKLTDRGGTPRSRPKKRPANEPGNAGLTTLIKKHGKDILTNLIKEHGDEILTYLVKVLGNAVFTATIQRNGRVGPEEMTANPKTFRRALRDKNFAWHTHGESWEVDVGSPEHQAMLDVLKTSTKRK